MYRLEKELNIKPPWDQRPVKNPIWNDYSSRYSTRWLRSQSCVCCPQSSLEQPPEAAINTAHHFGLLGTSALMPLYQADSSARPSVTVIIDFCSCVSVMRMLAYVTAQSMIYKSQMDKQKGLVNLWSQTGFDVVLLV